MRIIRGSRGARNTSARTPTSAAVRSTAGWRFVTVIVTALRETGLEDDTLVIDSSDHGDNLGARGLWGTSSLYRESVCVPLIMAGPGIPAGRVAWTPASLDALGRPDVGDGHRRASRSLLDLAGTRDHRRTVMSQYRAVGAPTGAFMVADARDKHHWHVDCPPELFDLRFDREETRNRAGEPAYQDVREHLHAGLLAHLGGRTPEQVDRMAKDDQSALVQRYGGPVAALEAATPVPGNRSFDR